MNRADKPGNASHVAAIRHHHIERLWTAERNASRVLFWILFPILLLPSDTLLSNALSIALSVAVVARVAWFVARRVRLEFGANC